MNLVQEPHLGVGGGGGCTSQVPVSACWCFGSGRGGPLVSCYPNILRSIATPRKCRHVACSLLIVHTTNKTHHHEIQIRMHSSIYSAGCN